MNLYIEIENQQTKNHPAFEDNLIEAFGAVPENWEQFIRIEAPLLGVYEKFASIEPIYSKINGVWTDVWLIREMTEEEKISKQQQTKDEWNLLPNRDNFTTWFFDELTCSYQPPIPRPETGNYFWQGTTSSWVEIKL
jgi:hypothetical protein